MRISSKVVKTQEAIDEFTVQEVMGGVHSAQAPVRVSDCISTETEWTHWKMYEKLSTSF